MKSVKELLSFIEKWASDNHGYIRGQFPEEQFKMLGKGWFSNVYVLPWDDTKCFKVADSTSDGWITYAMYAMANRNNPLVQKVEFLKLYDCYYVAIMERLDCNLATNGDGYLPESDRSNFAATFRAMLEYTVQYYDENKKRSISDDKFKWMEPHLAHMMKHIRFSDFYPRNVMIGFDKRVVITDPSSTAYCDTDYLGALRKGIYKVPRKGLIFHAKKQYKYYRGEVQGAVRRYDHKLRMFKYRLSGNDEKLPLLEKLVWRWFLGHKEIKGHGLSTGPTISFAIGKGNTIPLQRAARNMADMIAREMLVKPIQRQIHHYLRVPDNMKFKAGDFINVNMGFKREDFIVKHDQGMGKMKVEVVVQEKQKPKVPEWQRLNNQHIKANQRRA